MFDAAHVEVDRPPVFVRFAADERAVVVRVHVAQVVGGRTCEPGHRRQFERIAVGRRPPRCAGQRRFALFGGAEVADGRQFERQRRFRQRAGDFVAIVDREGFSPVTLAREDGVAQPVVDQPFAQSALLDGVEHLSDRLPDLHAVQKTGVDEFALLGVVGLLADVAACDDGRDFQPEMTGEGIVARVVRRHGHDRSGAVSRQHVVRDVDRYLASREGVDGIRTGEDAAHAPRLGDALALGAFLGLFEIILDGRLVFGRGELVDPFVFGSDDHEGDAEDRVGARGEDFEFAVETAHVEEDLCTLRAADPVTLDLFERFAPLERFQSVEHSLRIGRHAQQPLLHAFLYDGIAAAHRQPVLHLVVGQHRTQLRAPVDHRVGAVGQAVVLQHLFAPVLVHARPVGGREMQFGGAGRINPFGAAAGERLFQLPDRARLLPVAAIVAAEHFQEGPLRPLVVARVAGAHFAVPVERETDLVELFAVTGDVVFGGDGRMLSRLDGVLFGRQTEGVVAHRMQHVETALALVA